MAESTQANSERKSARVVHSETGADMNAELVVLRNKGDTLQASLQAFQSTNNARRKQARTLATLSVDTAVDLALPQRQDRSSTMESLIQRGTQQFQSANRLDPLK